MDGIYGGPGPARFVLTHSSDDTPDDPTVNFLSGDLLAAVATARLELARTDAADAGGTADLRLSVVK